MDKYGPGSLTNSLVEADRVAKELAAYRAAQIESGRLTPLERATLDRTYLAALKARDDRAAELDRLQALEQRQSLLANLYGNRHKLTQGPQRPASAPGGPSPTPSSSSD